MGIEQYHRLWRKNHGIIILALAVWVLLMNVQFCLGNDNATKASDIRARIFTLNNISAQTGRDYLKKLAIGETVLPIPGAKAMSVTGKALDLVKAGTVLSLVDSEEKYLVAKIALKEADSIPSYEALSRKLGSDISIGSLISRPASENVIKAIVDKIGDNLIIIATKEQLSKIIEAVEQLKKGGNIAPALPARAVNVPKPVTQPATQQPKNIAADAMEEEIIENLPDNSVHQAMLIPNGEDSVNIDLPEKLEIVQLIDIVGKLLNLDYLYDETKIKGNVTVKIQGKLKIKDLYALLENVLKFKGFVMSRSGNLVTIVPTAEALDTDPVFSASGIRPGDVVITRVFPLDYITTDAAKKVLVEMKLGASINEIPESGMLIITEFAFRMGRIEQLLELVDVSGESQIFKLRELRYTLVTSLVPKLQEMAEKLGSISVTVASSSATKPAAARTRNRRPAKPAVPAKTTTTTTQKFEVYIDYDERTNRVLMIGREDEIATVEELIDALDVPQQDLRTIHEYKIQYLGIEEVYDALEELGIIGSSKKTSGGPSTRRSKAAAAPAAAAVAGPLRDVDEPQVVQMESANSLLVNATPEQHIQIAQIISYVDREPEKTSIPYRIYRLENQDPLDLAETLNNIIDKTIKDETGKIQKKITREEDIAIVPDEKTFSIIVYASKRNQEWIGELITMLDKRRPQVLIDVSLVEIKKNEDFEFDLSVIANAEKVVTGNIAVTEGLLTNAVGSILEGGFNTVGKDGHSKSMRGFYSNDKIQALMTLIDQKGYGRVLAQPKVLVNDNEEGLIRTTEKTHVAEETQSYPGEGQTPVKSTKWIPYEAKIELTITPQISEGDLLRLEIKMVREDFIETLDGPPDYATSDVDTVVTVPDGSTIILGGLTKLNQTKSGSKVPGLGDIPLVGSLFKSTDNANDERRLYIFVKANILRPDLQEGLNQLKEISRKNQKTFEKHEDQFQKHRTIPGLDDATVEPRHVLEQMNGDANVPDEKVTETAIIELEPIKPAEDDLEAIDSLEMLEK